MTGEEVAWGESCFSASVTGCSMSPGSRYSGLRVRSLCCGACWSDKFVMVPVGSGRRRPGHWPQCVRFHSANGMGEPVVAARAGRLEGGVSQRLKN